MYRTRFASLRCPDIDDLADPADLTNLATDIQYHFEKNESRVTELQRRRGVRLDGDLPIFLGAASVKIPWSSALYDTENFFDPTVSVTDITIPKGVFLISGYIFAVMPSAVEFIYINIVGSVRGSVAMTQCSRKAGPVTPLAVTGILPSTNGESLFMEAHQVSTGTGAINFASLTIAKIGNL